MLAEGLVGKSPCSLPYAGKSRDVFHCPEDKNYGVAKEKGWPERVRSYSINIYAGGWSGWPFVGDQMWKIYRQQSDFRDPANRFVLMDMDDESINAGNYRVDMAGWPNKPKLYRFRQDWPASWHNNGVVSPSPTATPNAKNARRHNKHHLRPPSSAKPRQPRHRDAGSIAPLAYAG